MTDKFKEYVDSVADTFSAYMEKEAKDVRMADWPILVQLLQEKINDYDTRIGIKQSEAAALEIRYFEECKKLASFKQAHEILTAELNDLRSRFAALEGRAHETEQSLNAVQNERRWLSEHIASVCGEARAIADQVMEALTGSARLLRDQRRATESDLKLSRDQLESVKLYNGALVERIDELSLILLERDESLLKIFGEDQTDQIKRALRI